METLELHSSITIGYTSTPVASLDVSVTARKPSLKPIKDNTPKELPTNGAARTKLSREKAEANGNKQLSVMFPIAYHPLVKALAIRTRNGEAIDEVLAELVPARLDVKTSAPHRIYT